MANFTMYRGNYQPFYGLATYCGGNLTVAPSVVISGGGGTGATATAQIANGVVTSFIVTAPGSGYTSAPTVTVGGGLIGVQAVATVAGNAVTAITLAPVDLSVSGLDLRVLYKNNNDEDDNTSRIAFTLLNPGMPPYAGAVTLPNGGADGLFQWTFLPAHTDPAGNKRIRNALSVPLVGTARVYLPTSPEEVFDLASFQITLLQQSVRAIT